jgi:hypothetical protein
MGWVPLLYCDEMLGRWKRICELINRPFSPGQWRRAS